MNVFQKHIKVKAKDLDQLQHVNNVTYVQWVQDMAEAHWLSKADESILNSYFWVLIEHHIKYKGEAKLNDRILVKTYVLSSEGVTSTRKVEMINEGNDRLIVESTTKWCLMDLNTKRPTRITAPLKTLFS